MQNGIKPVKKKKDMPKPNQNEKRDTKAKPNKKRY